MPTVDWCDSGSVTRWRALDNNAAAIAPSVLAVTSIVGFVLVYLLTVRTTPGRQFGDASLRGALVTNSAVVDAVDAVLGVVSVATLLGGRAAIALIALVRLRRAPGLAAVGLLVAANTSTWLLKTHLLTRPALGLREIAPATHNSLPSGHTTAVFSVVVALLVVVPARARRPIAITGGAAAVVMALATMSAGWHRAGDSIAAFLVVGAWAGIAGIATVLADDTAPARVPAPGIGDRSGGAVADRHDARIRRSGILSRVRVGAHPSIADEHARRGIGVRLRRRSDRRGGGSGADGRAAGAQANRSLDPGARRADATGLRRPPQIGRPPEGHPSGVGADARPSLIGVIAHSHRRPILARPGSGSTRSPCDGRAGRTPAPAPWRVCRSLQYTPR